MKKNGEKSRKDHQTHIYVFTVHWIYLQYNYTEENRGTERKEDKNGERKQERYREVEAERSWNQAMRKAKVQLNEL